MNSTKMTTTSNPLSLLHVLSTYTFTYIFYIYLSRSARNFFPPYPVPSLSCLWLWVDRLALSLTCQA